MDERIQEMKDYGMGKAVRRGKNYKSDVKNHNDWNDYCDNGFEECHAFYRNMDKFLLSNINRPYKNVYADFCKKWPSRIGKYIDTRASFRNICGIGNTKYNSVCDFIVNEKVILKKNKESRRFKKKEKKKRVIGYKDDEKTYEIFNKALLKYPKILDFFNDILGYKNVTEIIESDMLPNKVSKIIHNNYCKINTFLRDKKGYTKNDSWVTKYMTQRTVIEVTEGTPEYTKDVYEAKQAIRVFYKRDKKIKESKIATLLHDLTQAAKRAEEEKNIVDRDRLGFNEESFMGEPYHGQKRKKK